MYCTTRAKVYFGGITTTMYMVHLNIELNNLDIEIKLWDVREELLRIFPHALDKHLPPISRDPDEMIFGFIYRVGTPSEFHALILSDPLSSG